MATDIPGFPQNRLDYKVTLYNGAALLPHITTPASGLQNGMVWTTTSGLFARINGATVGPYVAAGTITGWTASLNTAAPNGSTNVARFLVNTVSADGDAVIQPKGTGALLTQLPDATATGGDKRGTQAVDLQLSRSTATQVASGNQSSITGGEGNAATAIAAVVGGGLRNTASGSSSVVPGGSDCTAAGNNSFATGNDNVSDGNFTFTSGNQATTRGRNGSRAHASGQAAARGDLQHADFVLQALTPSNTATVMTLDANVTPGVDNQITLPTESAYGFSGRILARRTSNGNASHWKFEGTIRNVAGTTALVAAVTVTLISQDAGLAALVVAVTADNTLDCLRVTVTGLSAVPIKWVGYVDTIEIVG